MVVLLMVATTPELQSFADYEDFSRSFWTVQARDNPFPIKYRFRAAQRIMEYECRRMQQAGLMIRIKVIKTRQGGISTYWAGRGQHFSMSGMGRNGISVADKITAPAHWLQRAKRWHKQIPPRFRPSLAKSNATEMYYDKLDSRYSIGSQMGKTTGMSETILFGHLSEPADWRNPKKFMDDFGPAMPKNNPLATFCIEGTGWMQGDWWHGQVMLTLENGDDFTLVFIPWFIQEDYCKPPVGVLIDFTESEYTPEERHVVELGRVWAEQNPEHAYLAHFNGITIGHIAWRRWMIRNEFSGDIERFQSKYPATVHEAFLSSGSLALPLEIILHHQETVRVPLRYIRFRRTATGVVADDCERRDPLCWTIYEEPTEYCEYTVGGDPAEGKLSDTLDERSDRDNSSASAFNRRKLTFPARFASDRIAADLFGREMMLAGEYYNMAYLGGEVNNNGWATVTECKHYPNMLYRGGPPDNIEERDINQLWFKTTPGAGGTRNQLINTWIAGCRKSPSEHWNGSIIVCSEDLVREEKTFITKPNGKKEHRDGCKDDELFSHMLAYWTHLNTPHVRRNAMDHLQTTGRRRSSRPSMAYAGGVDDGKGV